MMNTTNAATTIEVEQKTRVIGAATGLVRRTLQMEGLAVFGGSVTFYFAQGYSGWLFALVCLAPDLSFLAYLAGPRVGALLYNSAHSYVGPIVLAISAQMHGDPVAIAVAVVWSAHIGFDRMLGYGLKYSTAFGDTHLGQIGRKGESAP